MTNFPWQNHFKNSLVGAKESYAKALAQASRGRGPKDPASADAGFLAYCLNEKLISTTDYLHWAKDVLEIPILIDDFFMAHAPPTRLFESRRELFAWGPDCLPVAEWDGVLIVACLQIPENFPATSPAVFLLASPERLAETWATYEAVAPVSTLDASEAIAQTNPGITIEAPVAAVSASLKIPTPVDAADALFGAETKPIKSLFDANGDLILAEDEISQTEAEPGSNPEIQVGAEDEAAGLPDGFFAETVVDTPLLSDLLPVESETKTHTLLAPTETGTTPVHDDTVALEETPAAMAFNEASVTVAFNEATAPAIATAKAEPEAKKPLTKGPRSVEVLGSAMSLAEMKAMKPVEEEHPAAAAAPNAPSASVPKTPVAPSMPKAPMKAANPSSSTAAYLLEKTRKANTDTFDKETMAAFQQLKTFFKKSMLLAIGDKDQVVKPLLWNSGFLMNTETPITEFPLNVPSFLRIVSTTQKPYHGFVTPNDANDSFFETWNQGEIPDHITVVPFMEGDLIVGMLLGIGEKSAYNRSVLQHTEAVAKELSAKILKPVGEHTKTGSVRSVA